MRRASFDKQTYNRQHNNESYSAAYNYYKTTNTRNVEIKRKLLQSSGQLLNNKLKKSWSSDNVVISSRGFKPSDIHDPAKRHFLENLSTKILHVDMDSEERTKNIDFEKLLRPAMDATDTCDLLQSKKKMYASSCFYAPTHPTVEDQVELARRISYSLSDVKNMKSKGQSMYVNRKKRSVKWIHAGNGEDGEEGPQMPLHRDKTPLKCMMNPNGKVMDMNGIQALGEEPNIGHSPINAGKVFDIVRDLNCQKGRGAEIFAKRRKRSEKWVVQENNSPSTPVTPVIQSYPKMPSYPTKMDYGANENSNFNSQSPMSPVVQTQNDSKPFYNPFTVDISLGTTPAQPDKNESDCNKQLSDNNYEKKLENDIKKIYLREVAIGTDQDYQINGHKNVHQVNGNSGVEKSRRMSFDSDCYQPVQHSNNNNNGGGGGGGGSRNYSKGDQSSRGGSSCNGSRAQMTNGNLQLRNGNYQNGNYNMPNNYYQINHGNYEMANGNQHMNNGYQHQMMMNGHSQIDNRNIQMNNGYHQQMPNVHYQMTNANPMTMNNGNYQMPNGNYHMINANGHMINGNYQMNNGNNYQMRNETMQNGHGYSNKIMNNTYTQMPNGNIQMTNGYNKNVSSQLNNSPNYQMTSNKNLQASNGHSQLRNENYQMTNGNQLQNETINEEGGNIDYTPVPVKQLIQEFEKTCRPTLQYKQMNSKAIPVDQQTPIDDLSRFFDVPRMPNKFDDSINNMKQPQQQQQQQQQVQFSNNNNGNNNKMMVNTNGNGYGGIYQGAMVPRYEYDSTDGDDDDDDDDDDDEIGDSFGESTTPENCNDYYSGPSPGFSTGNHPSAMSDYDYRRQLFDQTSEQLFDAPSGYRNDDIDDKFNDAVNDKPTVIIPSEQDIIEQIKQLRKTPVIESLIPGPSAEKLGDYCQDLGTKLLENTYNGPKISSFQTNYNTAPRGWDQAQSFYRPVTFAKSQEPIAYSDF